MYTLYIDTHSNYVAIVIFKDGKLLDKKESDSAFNHSTNTMPMIQEVLNEKNLKINDIDEIIVVNGPGSFTGVRIGVTIAKTISYTLNVPIKVISSLLIKAISSKIKDEKITIVSDKNGKFVGEFDQNNKELSEYKYLKNEEYEGYIQNKKNIIDMISINYNEVYKYLKDIDKMNPHGVNPLYVKNVEV